MPPDARDITTGQANRVWSVDASTPYILKRYGDPARAANEAAALRLLATHSIPGPRLLAAGSRGRQAWTAQTTVHAEPVPADRFLDEIAEPLTAVHRISGTHIGRLAGAVRHHRWANYLHDRLHLYATAAPDLARAAQQLRRRVDAVELANPPVLLHHDLQPGHLLREARGPRCLIDWELAVFGDERSDLGRLAVRLDLEDPTPVLAIGNQLDPTTEGSLHLHWHIHLLADAALGTDLAVRERARAKLPTRW
ncbi:phosphotransferase family protein [Streptomyces sp. WAC01526]|uniref:phosphotransferase family protein n=1 Tax=Streptomyces sp. WAC01526 TaxID=2588709 RepID=UPI001651C69B|nr:phosphotransferase [Streptomyces sp. WAC01526]